MNTEILKHLPNCKIFSTAQQETDEAGWLAARTRGIGGSDVGSICGVNKWATARGVYLQKTGQYVEGFNEFDDAAKDRMLFGHLLEPVVADEYARRTGQKVAVSPATLSHKDHPWALANVDRFIVDDNGKPIGILECKTSSEYGNEDWYEGDVPTSYLYQLMWYLWVTGLEYGAIACLVGGNKFYHYEVHYNKELMESEVIPTVDRFWNYHCKELVPPELSHVEADAELLDLQNPPEKVEKTTIFLVEDDTPDDLAASIIEAKAQIKELEKIVATAQNRLKEMIGLNQKAMTTGHTIAWSNRKTNRLDQKALKAERPDIHEKYVRESLSRAFYVKANKD